LSKKQNRDFFQIALDNSRKIWYNAEATWG